jgi:hypothetical protein
MRLLVQDRDSNDPCPVIRIQQHCAATGAKYPRNVIDRRLRIIDMLQHPLTPNDRHSPRRRAAPANPSTNDRLVRHCLPLDSLQRHADAH